MNKVLKIAAVAMAVACMATACSKKESNIQFVSQNPEGRQIVEGDLVYGEVSMKFNDTDMRNNLGHPALLFQITKPEYVGDLNDCLMQMHTGDHAIVTVECDSIAKYHGASALPPDYVADKGMKITFDITVTEVKNMQDMQNEAMEAMNAEAGKIAEYVANNNITATPTEDGLYVIVKQKGNGPKIGAGKTAMINYTGRLLNGKMFDSSVEADAKEGGVYDPRRPYAPLEYNVDKGGLIQGWIKGLDGQAQGSVITLIIPSALAYGPQSAGSDIGPFEPLTFDLEIVEVR